MRRYVVLLPFGIFQGLFLLLPVGVIVVRSFWGEGGLALSRYSTLARPLYVKSLLNSLSVSALTALFGVTLGFLVASGLVFGVSRKRRPFFLTLFATAANFAGVPLAVAFMVLFGLSGVFTRLWLQNTGFNLYSFWGLVLLYLYFQIPLAIVLTVPALESFHREWYEAAATLGGGGWLFWRKVGLPILAPALLGNGIFLFANSFGAYATAFALAGAKLRLLPIQISLAVAGNVGYDPYTASAMAVVMLLGLLGLFVLYMHLQRRFTLWVRR